ncbi:hypothetical protein BMT55_00970 [Listeria newyorkensis]|uniref:Uncharacterized protein n=1 Tax=Listeria newyorkensis TaxID=1497681 RepID=A0ABX4XRY2_9LIST|nr:hypothetical protein [Listeria newyorkensis]KGL43916.1 hypothetical protein EP58_05530 [Listeria newyorkensis]PNP94952.1 hypothetical protein BMT55_00970 [Listeria newyorkensis]SQC59796.1 Uncharacterised protein [Listeria newyorkensis]
MKNLDIDFQEFVLTRIETLMESPSTDKKIGEFNSNCTSLLNKLFLQLDEDDRALDLLNRYEKTVLNYEQLLTQHIYKLGFNDAKTLLLQNHII